MNTFFLDLGRKLSKNMGQIVRNVVRPPLLLLVNKLMMVWKQIDDGVKTNWGTGIQNLEKNYKIILSQSLSHFRFLKISFPGPQFYSFDWFIYPLPISESTIIDAKWHDWVTGSLISIGRSPQQKTWQNGNVYFQKAQVISPPKAHPIWYVWNMFITSLIMH